MFDPLIRFSARRRSLALGLAIGAGVAVVVAGELAYSLADSSLTSVRNRHSARLDAMSLRALLIDAETGQRGFLITGRDAYLEPLEAARPALAQVVRRLQRRYEGTQWDQLVDDLDQRALEKLSELDTTVGMYRRNPNAQWQELVKTDIGKEKMDAVRTATISLEAHESERIETERAAIYRALLIGRLGVHTGVAVALLGFFVFLRKNDAMDIARAELAAILKAERDQLDGEVRRRTLELTELARHLTSVREDERSYLARELHDELGALLTAAKLDIARARRLTAGMPEAIGERLVHMGKLIDEGITLKRRIIEDLHPSALSNLGLVPALEILTREFGERAGLAIHTDLLEVPATGTANLAMYRLVQEALTNALRHAQARQVWVSMKTDAEQLVLSVRDDGHGFVPQTVASGHHGLLGMRYRIEALGGRLQIMSAPGQGTEIEARLPQTQA